MSNLNKQTLTVLLMLLASIFLFEVSAIDIALQDYFYNVKIDQWLIDRDDVLLKFLFYDGIKRLYILFILLLLIALVFFNRNTIILENKKGLIIVCLSTVLVPLFVGSLKAITNIPCPKNLTHYSGSYPHVTLFKNYPSDFQRKNRIKCYPAGHASGGFALMSLFFLFNRKRNRVIALVLSITTGWLTGGYKMLIGDHFFSHTWVTMLLAGLIILIIARFVNVDDKLTV